MAFFLNSLKSFLSSVPNHPTSMGKRERQWAPSRCPPDSVPLAPRQGRSPVTCPPDRVPPFPLISGGFSLGNCLQDCTCLIRTQCFKISPWQEVGNMLKWPCPV